MGSDRHARLADSTQSARDVFAMAHDPIGARAASPYRMRSHRSAARRRLAKPRRSGRPTCTCYTNVMLDVRVPGSGRRYVDGDSLDHTGPLVFTIDDVLDADACARLVNRIESLGPSAAPITTARGFEMRSDIRNNTRVMFDDPTLAATLFDRIVPHLPQTLCDMKPVGANERFRCYRYDVDQRFAPHYDGAFIRNDDERSLLTFMVYLNDGFGGGATAFHSFTKDVEVTPKAGRALLFQHFLLHEGCFVTSGVKYVLRSDVMYRR